MLPALLFCSAIGATVGEQPPLPLPTGHPLVWPGLWPGCLAPGGMCGFAGGHQAPTCPRTRSGSAHPPLEQGQEKPEPVRYAV